MVFVFYSAILRTYTHIKIEMFDGADNYYAVGVSGSRAVDVDEFGIGCRGCMFVLMRGCLLSNDSSAWFSISDIYHINGCDAELSFCVGVVVSCGVVIMCVTAHASLMLKPLLYYYILLSRPSALLVRTRY